MHGRGFGALSTVLDLLDIMMLMLRPSPLHRPSILSFGGQRRDHSKHGMVGDGEKKL